MGQTNCKSVAIIAILLAAVVSGAMTIPLEKGNTWRYSYNNDSILSSTEKKDTVKQSGILQFTIEDKEIVSGKTFVNVSFFDSGSVFDIHLTLNMSTWKFDTIISTKPYLRQYKTRLSFAGDEIGKWDTTRFSPGFNMMLLVFRREPDTFYSSPYGFGTIEHHVKTDEYITSINQPSTIIIARRYDTAHSGYYLSSSTKNNSDTKAWIPSIGLISFSRIDSSISFNPSMSISIAKSNYTLISFNNTPVPPLSELPLQPSRVLQGNHRRLSSISTSSSQKLLVLSGRSGSLAVRGSGCFNLRGQRMVFAGRNQLVIHRQGR